jgi:hypothetical protein
MVSVGQARPDTVGDDCLPIPRIVAKDATCLGDNMPTFDIGEDGVLHLARLGVLGIKLGLLAFQLCFCKRHYLVSWREWFLGFSLLHLSHQF